MADQAIDYSLEDDFLQQQALNGNITTIVLRAGNYIRSTVAPPGRPSHAHKHVDNSY